MNWMQHQATEEDLKYLMVYNQPIPVPSGVFSPNAGVELFTSTGQTYNAIYDARLGAIRQLNTDNPVFNSMPNRDIALYNDHLKNPDVNTIVVDGFFGTGKTSSICSHLVTGLLQTMNQEEEGGIPVAYLSKPHVSLGGSYGHLPGGLLEKIDHEFRSYYQYFDRFGNPGLADFLMQRDVEELGKFTKHKMKEAGTLPGQKLLEVLPFEYLRGLDIEQGWVILDEAQNTDIKEMASFLSRPTDSTKMIITGDTTPAQIDRRGNTPEANGLAFAKAVYEGKKYAGQVTLQTTAHIIRGQRVRDLHKFLKAMA